MRRHTIAFLALAEFTTLASAPAHAQRPVVRDSAGIRIVTSVAPALNAAQALRIDPSPRLVIGTQDAVPYQLSRVAGAVRLSDGRIVIADGGSVQLRFFDARGTYIKASSGRGAGPGEFNRFESLQRLRGDTLAVTGDRAKVAYFDDSGVPLFEARHAPSLARSASARPSLRGVLAAFADGTAIVAEFGNPEPRPGVSRWVENFPVMLLDRRSALVHSLGDLPMSAVVMDGRPRPPWFTAPVSYAGTDDTFFIGLGTEYSIRAYTRDGKLARIIRRHWTPVRVTSRDIDTYVVEWGKRWITSTGADAERERVDLRDDPYEPVVPAFSRFIADRTGRLWVRTPNLADAPGAGQLNTSPLVPSTWSVFDRDAAWLCDVTLPAFFQPYDIGADYILGVARDDDGVQAVVQYALRAGK